MAPPPAGPAPLITDDKAQAPAPSLLPAVLIIGGLLLFAAAAIVVFRYLLRRWRSSSSRPRRGAPGAEAARREQAMATRTAAAGTEEVEVEAGAGRRIAAAAVGRAEAHSARGRVEAHSAARGPAETEIVEVEEWEDDDMELLIASLPLFTRASVLAAVPKNSPDCAVCLSPFDPEAALRLLPACRHAFHAACIDPWLLTNPVCPICRAFVSFPPPPLPSAPSAAVAGQEDPLGGRRSFRVELGSVSSSRRRSCPDDDHRRTYSLGNSFDYRVDEEVEAIVSRIVRPASAAAARPRLSVPTAPEAPGEALAEAVGSRGWLNEYLDRVSGRWSGRLSQGGRRSHSRRHGDSSRWDPEAAVEAGNSATPAAGKAAMGEAAAGTCGGGLGERRDGDNLASSAAPSFSGRWSRRWSLGHRRDESWRWDPEAACGAPGEAEREPPALVALGRWVLGF